MYVVIGDGVEEEQGAKKVMTFLVRVGKLSFLQRGTACIDIEVGYLCLTKSVLTISSRKLGKTRDNDLPCCSPKDTLNYVCLMYFKKGPEMGPGFCAKN